MLINELNKQAQAIVHTAPDNDLVQVNLISLLMYTCNYKLQLACNCSIEQSITLDMARTAIKTERKNRGL